MVPLPIASRQGGERRPPPPYAEGMGRGTIERSEDGGGVKNRRKRRLLMTTYMTGFGNHFATEAVPGALPVGQNSPQKPAFGLYTEQLSGTAFTAPRHDNR